MVHCKTLFVYSTKYIGYTSLIFINYFNFAAELLIIILGLYFKIVYTCLYCECKCYYQECVCKNNCHANHKWAFLVKIRTFMSIYTIDEILYNYSSWTSICSYHLPWYSTLECSPWWITIGATRLTHLATLSHWTDVGAVDWVHTYSVWKMSLSWGQNVQWFMMGSMQCIVFLCAEVKYSCLSTIKPNWK